MLRPPLGLWLSMCLGQVESADLSQDVDALHGLPPWPFFPTQPSFPPWTDASVLRVLPTVFQHPKLHPGCGWRKAILAIKLLEQESWNSSQVSSAPCIFHVPTARATETLLSLWATNALAQIWSSLVTTFILTLVNFLPTFCLDVYDKLITTLKLTATAQAGTPFCAN